MTCGCGSNKVFVELWNYGATIKIRENESSLLHALCWASYFDPLKEANCAIIFQTITDMLDQTELVIMMNASDDEGQRPLELAAKLGTFLLFNDMLNSTRYRRIGERFGAFTEYIYTISEYDSDRSQKSPLQYFINTQVSDIHKPGFDSLFKSKVIMKWIRHKLESKMSIIRIWFLMRVICTLVILWTLTDVENSLEKDGNCTVKYRIHEIANGDISSKASSLFLVVTTDLLQTLFLLSDLFDCGYYIVKRRNILAQYVRPQRGNYFYLLDNGIHHAIRSLMTLCITIWLVFGFYSVRVNGEINESDMELWLGFIYIAAVFLSVISILFFLQFVPYIGHLVIGLRVALKTFMSCFVLNIMLFIAFTTLFALLAKLSCYPVEDDQSKDFSYLEAIYFSLRVYLSQVNVSDIQTDYAGTWKVVHWCYAVVVVVLFVNYCIAAIAQSTQDIVRFQHHVQMILYLTVALSIEEYTKLIDGILAKICPFFFKRRRQVDELMIKIVMHNAEKI